MTFNVRLKVAYDGTHYFGWQKTNKGPSIEQTLEVTLNQILQHPLKLQAASRTDRGVHAEGQVVNFLTDKDVCLRKLQISLNQLLPKDIAIIDASYASAEFHPTLDAVSKTYRYQVCLGPYQLPSLRLYSWHFPYPLDFQKMEQAKKFLLGEQDFSAFCNMRKNLNYPHKVRLVSSIELDIQERSLFFAIRGEHFLYKMVRNLVGLLLYVGKDKIDVDSVPLILASKERQNGAVTAPAHGLTLEDVFYGKK